MYICFDKEGVLNIKPDNYSDSMVLRSFLKEYSAHGGKMINIEPELDESKVSSKERYNSYENPYGYQNNPYEGAYGRYHEVRPTYDEGRSPYGYSVGDFPEGEDIPPHLPRRGTTKVRYR